MSKSKKSRPKPAAPVAGEEAPEVVEDVEGAESTSPDADENASDDSADEKLDDAEADADEKAAEAEVEEAPKKGRSKKASAEKAAEVFVHDLVILKADWHDGKGYPHEFGGVRSRAIQLGLLPVGDARFEGAHAHPDGKSVTLRYELPVAHAGTSTVPQE